MRNAPRARVHGGKAAAVSPPIWYERALKTPGNLIESTLALRYDLGVAQETAGEQMRR